MTALRCLSIASSLFLASTGTFIQVAAAPQHDLAGGRSLQEADTEQRDLAPDVTEEEKVRHGQVLLAEPMVALRDLVLTMESSDGEEFPFHTVLGGERPQFGQFEWAHEQNVTIAADGTFSAKLPKARYVRFVVRGRFLLGIAPFEVGGAEDPGADPIKLQTVVGGEVTLQLRLQGEFTDQERGALIGRQLSVMCRANYGWGALKKWPEEGASFGEIWRTGEIDEELRVRLPHLPLFDVRIAPRGSGTYAASGPAALAPFYSPAGLQLRAECGRATKLVVPLRRGFSFGGAVLDPTGHPVPGATLDLVSGAGTPASYHSCRCVADDDGNFSVDGLPRRPETITAYATGFRQAKRDVTSLPSIGAADDIRIVLDPGKTLRVQVQAADGRVARGVPLTLIDPDNGGYRACHSRTDADGIATFELLSGEPVKLTGSAVEVLKGADSEGALVSTVARFQGSNRSAYSRRAGSERVLWILHEESLPVTDEPVEIALRKAPKIRGVVKGIDPARGPTRVVISGLGPHSRGYGLRRDRKASLTLEAGSVEFMLELAPGHYHVAATQGTGAQLPDMGKLRATPHVDVAMDSEDVSVELDFGLAVPMEGSIRFADGSAAAGLSVRVTRMTGGYSDATFTTMTDADGAFLSTPLLRGSYLVSASGDNDGVTAWLDDYTLQFDPADPKPVALVAVLMGWVDVEWDSTWENVRMAGERHVAHWYGPLRRDKGSGRVGPVRPGRYAFAEQVVHSDGSVTMEGSEVVVPEGAAVPLLLAPSLETPARIHGRVLSGDKPIVGIGISAEVDGFKLAWATTGLGGHYKLALDYEGPVTLRLGTSSLRDLGQAAARATPEDAQAQDVIVPTGAIRVRMRRSLGMDDWLHLYRLDEDGKRVSDKAHRVVSNQVRDFVYLEDGRYEITRTDWSRTVTARAEAEVTRGRQVVVEMKAVGR